jgi:hypothetical protein
MCKIFCNLGLIGYCGCLIFLLFFGAEGSPAFSKDFTAFRNTFLFQQKWANYQERKSWGRGCTEEETAADLYSPFD